MSREALDAHVQVRSAYIDVAGDNVDLTVHLQIGWVAAVYYTFGVLDAPPASPAEAALGFDDVLAVDLDAEPRPWADVWRFLRDCERQFRVTLLQDDWCWSYVELDAPARVPRGAVSYTFGPATGGTPVVAEVYPFGDLPDTCEVAQWAGVPIAPP